MKDFILYYDGLSKIYKLFDFKISIKDNLIIFPIKIIIKELNMQNIYDSKT